MGIERRTATLSGALEYAIAFAREGWREAWAALAIQAMGVALFYFAFEAPVRMGAAVAMVFVGLALALVASPMAVGALYRLALDGPLIDELGVGGLQWWRTESHLALVWLLFLLLAVVVWFPLTIVSALALWLFHASGLASLGPLGRFQIGFLIAAGILGTGLLGWIWLMFRLALAPVAAVAEGRVMLFDAWPLSAGQAFRIGLSWIVLHLPVVVSWGLAFLLTAIEARASGTVKALPLPEAVVTALVIGAVSGFMQTPLTVGAFSYFYRPRAAQAPSPLRFAEGL